MQSNSPARFALRLSRIAVQFLTTLLVLASNPVQAAPEKTYEVDGYRFSEASRARIGTADEQMKLGISALKSGDWARAQRLCDTALNTYVDVGIPLTENTRPIFDQAKTCLADTYAAQGDWDRACRIYQRLGFKTYRFTSPRMQCEKFSTESDPNRTNHTQYTAAFAGFAGRLTALNGLPEGNARNAKVAELAKDCVLLRGFSPQVPPALGAASYCSGIVAFENGDPEKACKILWAGAKETRTALAGQLRQEQRDHAAELRDRLATFRPICADSGYAWPD